MSKHTPGPWLMRESATHVTVTNACGDAVFHDDKRIPGVMPDARLIAAAPELLEALQELRYAATDKAEQMADAAIAKATGESAWAINNQKP